MTDTTKPNGDRDHPSDREAAKNPRAEWDLVIRTHPAIAPNSSWTELTDAPARGRAIPGPALSIHTHVPVGPIICASDRGHLALE